MHFIKINRYLQNKAIRRQNLGKIPGHIKKYGEWEEEMSLWVEHQLCKHEYLCLDCQHSCTIARHGSVFQ